jgi:anti-sigma B factor antagonist
MSEIVVERGSGEPQVAVVKPLGRLDMQSAPALRQELSQLVERGQVRVVLDLDGVGFMDSSGLGAIIGGLKAARQTGGDLRIARPNQQVRLVLELTSLDRVLRPYGSVEEAGNGF